MMADYCFRSRIETAKAQLKKMFSVDVCQQMDVLFADVLQDLEAKLSTHSSQSVSSNNSCSLNPCSSHSDDSGIHSTTSSSSDNEQSLLIESSKDFPPLHSNDDEDAEKSNSHELSTCTAIVNIKEEKKSESLEKEERSFKKLKTESETYTASSENSIERYLKKSRSKLNQFKILAIGVNYVTCPIAWCDHISYRRHQFIGHFETVHPEISSLNCVQCNLIMYRPWDMFMHELMYHLTGFFECTFEGCTFIGQTRGAVLSHYDVVHLFKSPKRPRYLPILPTPVAEEEIGSQALVVSQPQQRKQFDPMAVDQWRSKGNSANGYNAPSASVVSHYNANMGSYNDQQPLMPALLPPAQNGNSAYQPNFCSNMFCYCHEQVPPQQLMPSQEQMMPQSNSSSSAGYDPQHHYFFI